MSGVSGGAVRPPEVPEGGAVLTMQPGLTGHGECGWGRGASLIFIPQPPNLSPGHSPLKICFSKQPLRIVLITKGWGQQREGDTPPRGREGVSGQRDDG